jgi:trimeric autotransporter adhesin
MTQAYQLSDLGQLLTVDAVGNNITLAANSVVVGNASVNATINSTAFTGTANNTNYVGTVPAGNVVSYAQLSNTLSNYQTTAGLNANIASYLPTYAGVVNAASYTVGTSFIANNSQLTITTPLSANGGVGTAGYVLTSNGATGSPYWAVASAGVNVAAQYTWSNTQTFTNTITFNSTINGTANNALYLGGTAAASYQTTAGLSANVATLSANNASYLGGVAAASYVNTSGAYTRTGVTTFSANVIISTTAGISANGSFGTANQVLTSNGSTVYWSTVSGGGGGTPGGSNTQVQFNNSGSFGASAGLTFNTTSNTLLVSNSIGIGISSPAAAVHANGNIYATGDVVTNYSDIRLKDVSGTISNAVDKVSSLTGFYYTPNDLAISMGVEKSKLNRVGISAQDLQLVLPEAVRDAPGANGYLTVQYERIVPLLIEAIKELKAEINELKAK